MVLNRKEVHLKPLLRKYSTVGNHLNSLKLMTEHQDDIDIDRNLKILCESKNTSEFDLTDFTDKNGRQLHSSNESKAFARLMEREGLIRVFDDFCALERFRFEVCKVGGWLKYISDKEKQESELDLKIKEKENLELSLLKYQNDIKDKEREIIDLTDKNLRLQNKQMKRTVLYSIIGFLSGVIVTNLKDILILLNLMNPE